MVVVINNRQMLRLARMNLLFALKDKSSNSRNSSTVGALRKLVKKIIQ
jgi:hypothetical protein